MRILIVLSVYILLVTNTSQSAISQGQDIIKFSNRNIESDGLISRDSAVYQLYPTEHTWIFIKLNTRNGLMWLVQYHLDEKSRFQTYLNLKALVPEDKEVSGRFTLTPTQNIYTFILLDQIDGRTWQVQWSTKPEERLITPID